ncbi:MAG: PKD domain-containing protein, partial [Bacteroidia bacterium]|nr:PKD domain-containing protein [Bacteroidia bacterium]
MIENKSYVLSIETSSSNSQDTKAWIDYDNDGIFNDSTELILTANNKYDPSATILIRSNSLKNTALRMRITSDYTGSNPSSCTDLDYGQAEDYTVIIRENTLPPVAKFYSPDSVNCDGMVELFDSTENNVDTWFWDFGDGSTDTAQNPSHFYLVDSDYDITLIVTNAYGADTLVKPAYISVASYFCDTIIMPSSSTDTIYGCGGIVFEPGGPNNYYMNNENSKLLLLAPGADSITFNFEYFQLHNYYDYLYIYNDLNATNLIGSYTGYNLPNGGIVVVPGDVAVLVFTSNSWTTYEGFQATWKANFSSGIQTPIAAFSASDVNPPFNMASTFTDLSTGYPNSWYWNFGDGTEAYTSTATHGFSASDTFNVMLVVSNCVGQTDTAYQQIIVQGAPDIEYDPEYFNVTLITDDSTTLPLTIQNSGMGPLNYALSTTNITGNSSQQNSFAFYDGFEDGTYSLWQDAGGTYTREITTSSPAQGTSSFKLTGGNTNVFDGIYADFAPDTHSYVSFYVKSSSTSNLDVLVVGGDENTASNYGLFFFYANDDGTF